jgi:hypothetical protein
LIEHEIKVTPDFSSKPLREYRVAEHSISEMDRQLIDLVKLAFIQRRKTPMASPFVPVLKGPDWDGGMRNGINYQYLNNYTVLEAMPMLDIADNIHGQA